MYARVCHHRSTYKMHLSGGNVWAGCSIWDVSIVNENCRSVLSGTDGRMVQFGNFLQKERVVGEVFTEPLKLFTGCSGVVVAKIVKSQQDSGKRHEKTAMIGYQSQLFYALFLVAFEPTQAKHPADRSGLASDDVFTHSGSDVGVVVVGRTRKQGLRASIGRVCIRERAEFFLGDKRGIVS